MKAALASSGGGIPWNLSTKLEVQPPFITPRRPKHLTSAVDSFNSARLEFMLQLLTSKKNSTLSNVPLTGASTNNLRVVPYNLSTESNIIADPEKVPIIVAFKKNSLSRKGKAIGNDRFQHLGFNSNLLVF